MIDETEIEKLRAELAAEKEFNKILLKKIAEMIPSENKSNPGDSWIGYVDRQSGAFDDEEIKESLTWR